jgi:murein DD-endopeptidase MepM/ murein hydrolase activator NlpD
MLASSVMRIARPTLLILISLLSSFAYAEKPAPRWTVTYQPIRVVNGAPILFRVTTPRVARSLSAKWIEHEVVFTYDANKKAWFGFAGASLETKPGAYPLELHAEMNTGPALTYKQEIKVQKQRYPRVIVLKVPQKFTAPDPEQLRVIDHDKQVKAEAFKSFTPDREWKGEFQRPVTAEISDVFGVQRVFNGSVQSTHQGLDFRVPTGTPVSAVNAGTVILARPLYFEGNCIVLDHGQGLLTLYLHLSEFQVKEGDHVAKGQLIALSGGTGRATGPHLHLAVRWQGVYLNPAGLLALPLP